MEHEKFIKGLEKEHAMIEKAFKKLEPIIENKDIRDTAYVLKIIEQLKTILINHLRDEDNKFYPAMRQKAIELKQDALLPALDIFIDGMKDISKNIFEETESLLANPPPPPIHSEEELWNFAYHYGDLVKDKTLGELCTQITGYVDGKCSTLQPLHERVRQIPSINEATFNPDDLRIYQRLHQGLIRYTQDGFKCEKKN